MATTKKKAAGLTIKLVKSTIGCKKDQIATVKSLGLHKVGETCVQPDNVQTRGKVNKVSHLVKIIEG